MPTDVNCVTHSDRRAVGYCSRCQMAYCSDCLDVEMGQPLCLACKKKFSQTASSGSAVPSPGVSSPAGGSSPLNFKGRGLDDDLLGLLGAPTPSMAEPPKAVAPHLPQSAPAPNLDFSMPSRPPASAPPAPVSAGQAVPPPLKPMAPLAPPSPAASTPKPSLDFDSLIQSPQAPLPTLPKNPAAPLSFTKDSMAGLSIAPSKKKNKIISLGKIWAKYLLRRSYEMFDPLAQKLKVPTYVFLCLVAALATGVIIGIGAWLNRPAVAMADTVPSIHMVQVNSGQISEMDVTTYTDLQNQVQTMGFTPLMQMTVPQLPSPNFFDVGMKENIGTYSEILKRTGTITPHLSFVTVFTNGVWYSTNGWDGKNQQMEYLISEFFPQDSPDQLYVKHVQGVEKLKQDKDWQVQSISQNRYMAALSDHLRWFLVKTGIPGYSATFDLWH